MTYRTIMVHVGVDSQTPNRLQAALALGERFAASIVGVGALTWDTYIDPVLGYTDGETVRLLRDQTESDIAAAEAAFSAATEGYAHPVAWRSMVDYPAYAMNRLAGGADLIVASRAPRGADHRRFASPTDLIMGSGLPVILVPPGQKAFAADKVLIGWKNTRESRRAVSDALPMLKAAERVYLVQVAEKDALGGTAQPELDDVVERLTRHGVFAEASTAPRIGASVMEDLMTVADSRDCGLVVLGAYGHTRLREWAFGGVTADGLAAGSRPILFSR